MLLRSSVACAQVATESEAERWSKQEEGCRLRERSLRLAAAAETRLRDAGAVLEADVRDLAFEQLTGGLRARNRQREDDRSLDERLIGQSTVRVEGIGTR